MLTGAQIRAARAALGWNAEKLAEASGVSSKTIRRIEASEHMPSGTASTQLALQSCLEDAGIEFIGSPDDRPGIRINTGG